MSENHDKLQKDLDTIQRWSEKWQLTFNIKKCKRMHFGNYNERKDYFLNTEAGPQLIT